MPWDAIQQQKRLLVCFVIESTSMIRGTINNVNELINRDGDEDEQWINN